MKRLIGALLLATTSCAALGAVVPILSQVIVGLQEAAQVLSWLESVITTYFLAHPGAPPADQKKANEALMDAKLALTAATSAAKGAKDADDKNFAAARTHFEDSYKHLVSTLMSLGIVRADLTLSEGTDKAVTVPRPTFLQVDGK